MITVLNRKNVYASFDLKRSSAIRSVLADNHIPYTVNTKNQMGQWTGHGTLRGRTGSLGQSADAMYEYEIFVHKDNYEEAMHLIRQIRD